MAGMYKLCHQVQHQSKGQVMPAMASMHAVCTCSGVHFSDASWCAASAFQEMVEAGTAQAGPAGQGRGLPDRLRNWSGRMGGSLTAMVDTLTKGACRLRQRGNVASHTVPCYTMGCCVDVPFSVLFLLKCVSVEVSCILPC